MAKAPPNSKPLPQVAAVPVRRRHDGTAEILLVTTRSTKRWTLPKGWPVKKLKGSEAAAKEAFEEGGVVGRIRKKPIGRYLYWKRMDGYFSLCKVRLYVLNVAAEHPDWPEKGERLRSWFKWQDAADLVEEPGLRKLLKGVCI
ncbi:8-oxo-dGTP pyrophosphatase MutT (NUDIX family) [Bosea sp. OAE752]|uniref:NUDIX hydrolase n=1 Tax=Bosea sp. OAE752 TaxID=2663873 RepID=UPI000DDA1C52